MKNNLIKFSLITAGLVAIQSLANAATIGYWRFESGSFLTDSSGNGLTLTNNASVAQAANTGFSNPVPSSGATNSNVADVERGSSQYFSVADNALFAFQDFTVESYANIESTTSTGTHTIASQFGGGGQQGWRLLVTSDSSGSGPRNLVMQLDQTGSSSISFDSDFQLTVGSNYYLAASVDIGVSNTSVTFYFQNLTLGSAIQSITKTGAITSLFNSTGDFRIGASVTPVSNFYDGTLDELRLSDTALLQSDLLISSIPEPSTYAMLAGGLVLLFAVRPRKVSAA